MGLDVSYIDSRREKMLQLISEEGSDNWKICVCQGKKRWGRFLNINFPDLDLPLSTPKRKKDTGSFLVMTAQ